MSIVCIEGERYRVFRYPLKGQEFFGLIVQGHLEAIGTSAQPITFTSEIAGPGQWDGIAFTGGSGHLRHTTVRYGGDYKNIGNPHNRANIAVLDVLTGQVLIESSQILSASYGSGQSDRGLTIRDSTVVLSDTVIAGNGDGTNDFGIKRQAGIGNPNRQFVTFEKKT